MSTQQQIWATTTDIVLSDQPSGSRSNFPVFCDSSGAAWGSRHYLGQRFAFLLDILVIYTVSDRGHLGTTQQEEEEEMVTYRTGG